MKITDRQAHVLAQLHRIEARRTSQGNRAFFLDKDNCTSAINSLIVKGMVVSNDDRTRLERAAQAASSR